MSSLQQQLAEIRKQRQQQYHEEKNPILQSILTADSTSDPSPHQPTPESTQIQDNYTSVAKLFVIGETAVFQMILEYLPLDPDKDFSTMLQMKLVNKSFQYIVEWVPSVWNQRQLTISPKVVHVQSMVCSFSTYYYKRGYNLGPLNFRDVTFEDPDLTMNYLSLALTLPQVQFINCSFADFAFSDILRSWTGSITVNNCKFVARDSKYKKNYKSESNLKAIPTQTLTRVVLENMDWHDYVLFLEFFRNMGIHGSHIVLKNLDMNILHNLGLVSVGAITLGPCDSTDTEKVIQYLFERLNKPDSNNPQNMSKDSYKFWQILGKPREIYVVGATKYISSLKNTADKKANKKSCLMRINSIVEGDRLGEAIIPVNNQSLSSKYASAKSTCLKLLNHCTETKMKRSLSDSLRHDMIEQIAEASRLVRSQQLPTEFTLKRLTKASDRIKNLLDLDKWADTTKSSTQAYVIEEMVSVVENHRGLFDKKSVDYSKILNRIRMLGPHSGQEEWNYLERLCLDLKHDNQEGFDTQLTNSDARKQYRFR